MSLKTHYYIKEEYISNLKNYKYSGADYSIYYKYVISPICNYITNYLPTWLMPNTITVMGWVLNVITIIITTYYGGWKVCYTIPSWVCYLAALNHSLYIYIDAIDGKQARRIKASTPLGVLFDHGCDACTCFIISINASSLFYYDSIYQYLLIFISLSFTFYLNFIEEYYTGFLDLPIINGVEEGSLYVSLIFFLSGYYGPSFYNKTFTFFNKYDLKISEINGLAVFIGSMLHCFNCFYDIIKKVEKNKIIPIFKSTFFYFLYLLSILCVVGLSDSIFVKEYPKLIIINFGIQAAKIFSVMQVSHVISSNLDVYRPVFLIPIFSLIIHCLVYYYFKITLFISIDKLIMINIVWNFLSWLHYVYFCSEEICEVLNINRFLPGKKNASRPAYGEEEKIEKKNE